MEDSKNWWKSKTIWGGIATVALGALQLIDQNLGIKLVNDQVMSTITMVLGMFGIYGRVNAKKSIQ